MPLYWRGRKTPWEMNGGMWSVWYVLWKNPQPDVSGQKLGLWRAELCPGPWDSSCPHDFVTSLCFPLLSSFLIDCSLVRRDYPCDFHTRRLYVGELWSNRGKIWLMCCCNINLKRPLPQSLLLSVKQHLLCFSFCLSLNRLEGFFFPSLSSPQCYVYLAVVSVKPFSASAASPPSPSAWPFSMEYELCPLLLEGFVSLWWCCTPDLWISCCILRKNIGQCSAMNLWTGTSVTSEGRGPLCAVAVWRKQLLCTWICCNVFKKTSISHHSSA